MAEEEKPLQGVYLHNGSDELKRQTLLQRLSKRMQATGDMEMNTSSFNAANLKSIEPVLDAINTMPFGADKRLVIIKDADKLPKAIQDALAAELQVVVDTAVVLLTATKLDARSRLYKVIASRDKRAVIDCEPMKGTDLVQLVTRLAAAQGVSLAAGAAALLIEMVGDSTVALRSNTNKLAAFVRAAGRDCISADDIRKTVTRTVEAKPWNLTDALAERDLRSCLLLLGRLESQDARFLFTQCVARLREILSIKLLKDRGDGNPAAALGKQEWQIRASLRGAARYPQQVLVQALIAAPQIEQQMKSGADPDHLLRVWLVDCCTT
ncbi:MAG: DNA polymerase III subunit delta [Coriobacteriales bacterium]|jgi:DNA polymerase-3 subunit delta|nr:DNA polymerase III subunit delta [Coriobacteriales bacterium]